jgi:SPP1 gp7 family putative phage head morphogenesis protein
MTRNEQYWIDRANRRMDGYQISAIKQAKIINKSYNQTCNYVQSEIAKILRHIGDEDSLAYEYRMKRLNALLARTQKKMQELYGVTLNDTTDFLKSIIPEAYYHTIYDIAQGIGEQPVFSAVNKRLIDQIVNDQWSGKNYSQRIWWNTSKLSEDVQQLLTTAAMSGESINKTSRRLSERFGQSIYNSQRLIRTETTYSCNQAELASYEELDIDRYKYVATLDSRTSPICQKLDGQVFKTKDAKAGTNLPAMHPNCRSTTIAYFEDGMPDIRIAKDKDGKNIKVPASMTYDEWYDKYIKPTEGEKSPQKPPKAQPGKSVSVEIPAPQGADSGYTDVKIPKRGK